MSQKKVNSTGKLQNHVQQSSRSMHSDGHLSSSNLQGRPQAVPLSTAYLNPQMSSGYQVPPVPARRTSYPVGYSRYGGMNGYYSPYSRYSGGLYSPGGMGGYRMSPYGHYGAPADGYNSFIQMAEESTRPAFESIESVVEVVSSISMMLESTYHAVHSSYSAILGVVDQFSRLKDHLAQIFSILALLRGLRWLCLKILYILKLRKENPSIETAWNSAEQMAGNSSALALPGEARGSAWPFLMFVSLVVGAPWLMFKLLSKSVAKKPLDMSFFKDEFGDLHYAKAGYDFTGSQRGELSFRAGERLCIAPKCYPNQPKGWLVACNDRQQTGLIPANYLITSKSGPNPASIPRAGPSSSKSVPNEVTSAPKQSSDTESANSKE